MTTSTASSRSIPILWVIFVVKGFGPCEPRRARVVLSHCAEYVLLISNGIRFVRYANLLEEKTKVNYEYFATAVIVILVCMLFSGISFHISILMKLPWDSIMPSANYTESYRADSRRALTAIFWFELSFVKDTVLSLWCTFLPSCTLSSPLWSAYQMITQRKGEKSPRIVQTGSCTGVSSAFPYLLSMIINDEM